MSDVAPVDDVAETVALLVNDVGANATRLLGVVATIPMTPPIFCAVLLLEVMVAPDATDTVPVGEKVVASTAALPNPPMMPPTSKLPEIVGVPVTVKLPLVVRETAEFVPLMRPIKPPT